MDKTCCSTSKKDDIFTSEDADPSDVVHVCCGKGNCCMVDQMPSAGITISNETQSDSLPTSSDEVLPSVHLISPLPAGRAVGVQKHPRGNPECSHKPIVSDSAGHRATRQYLTEVEVEDISTQCSPLPFQGGPIVDVYSARLSDEYDDDHHHRHHHQKKNVGGHLGCNCSSGKDGGLVDNCSNLLKKVIAIPATCVSYVKSKFQKTKEQEDGDEDVHERRRKARSKQEDGDEDVHERRRKARSKQEDGEEDVHEPRRKARSKQEDEDEDVHEQRNKVRSKQEDEDEVVHEQRSKVQSKQNKHDVNEGEDVLEDDEKLKTKKKKKKKSK